MVSSSPRWNFRYGQPGGELRARLPGAVVSRPQWLIFSQNMQPPAAPQIVEQRRPNSSVDHLSTLIIAPFDPAANDDSLLLDDHLFASVVFQIKCRSFSFLLMMSVSSASKLRQWQVWRTEISRQKYGN
jgi:hypothetical protein